MGLGSPGTETEPASAPPVLTAREGDVLSALCRPLLRGDVFCEPASIVEMAREMNVSPDAVKKHLAHLYTKFGIIENEGRRRVALANAAIQSGAVRVSDLNGPR
jgi:DNA-binding NarL/FixJ family response regulator